VSTKRKPTRGARPAAPGAKAATAGTSAPSGGTAVKGGADAARAGAPAKGGASGKAAASGPSAPAAPRTRRLAAAALIAGLEGAALALFGLGMLGYAVLGHPTSRGDAAGSGVTLAVIALLPLVAALGLWRVRRWSRGPALIIQIVALPVSWTLLHAGSPALWAGIGLGVAALAELVLLVHPAATEALGIGRGAES
jgi:hypothetical protein